MINGLIGFFIGTIVTAITLEALNLHHYNELLQETENCIDTSMKLLKERDHLKKANKRLQKENNRLQIKIVETQEEEPEVRIVKINDKVKTEKPWCSF